MLSEVDGMVERVPGFVYVFDFNSLCKKALVVLIRKLCLRIEMSTSLQMQVLLFSKRMRCVFFLMIFALGSSQARRPVGHAARRRSIARN